MYVNAHSPESERLLKPFILAKNNEIDDFLVNMNYTLPGSSGCTRNPSEVRSKLISPCSSGNHGRYRAIQNDSFPEPYVIDQRLSIPRNHGPIPC